MGSVEMLHFKMPGVVKTNDHVIANVTTPISDPIADKIAVNAPAASKTAVVSSMVPNT